METPKSKRAALRAGDANRRSTFSTTRSRRFRRRRRRPRQRKRNAVLSPMARRLVRDRRPPRRQPRAALVVETAHGSGANFMRPADGATPPHAAAFVGDACAAVAGRGPGSSPTRTA